MTLRIIVPAGGVTKDEARALAVELLAFAHDEEEMVVVPKRSFKSLQKALKKLSKARDEDFYCSIRYWQVLRWVKKLAKGSTFSFDGGYSSSLRWEDKP